MFGVEEIEGDDREAESAEGARAFDHPRMTLARAGAMPENQHGARGARLTVRPHAARLPGAVVCRIHETRRRDTRLDHQRELLRTFQAPL